MNRYMHIVGHAVCSPDYDVLAKIGVNATDIQPELMPAGVRRRCSLTTRMAVTAAHNACAESDVDTTTLPAVFASIGGEIQVTDALCRVIPDNDALLSPTQFHNSVHNTTAGYWSILNQCRAPITAIAAYDDTLAMAFFEAWAKLQQMSGHLLLVLYEESWPQYLAPPIGQNPAAAALLLSNVGNSHDLRVSLPKCTDKPLALDDHWEKFIRSSPTAMIFPLLEMIDNRTKGSQVPLNLNDPLWVTELF